MKEDIRTTHERHDMPVDLPPNSQRFLRLNLYVRASHQLRAGVDIILDESNMDVNLLLVVSVLDVDRDPLVAQTNCRHLTLRESKKELGEG